MKLIIIWDQVVVCWKKQKDIAFFGNTFAGHLSPMLIKKKQGFNQEGGINQKKKKNRAQRTPGARKTLAANGVFCLGNVPARVNWDFSSLHSMWCLVLFKPLTSSCFT